MQNNENNLKKSTFSYREYDFLPDFELWEQIYVLKSSGFSFRGVAKELEMGRNRVTSCWKRWIFDQVPLFQQNINYLCRHHRKGWDALNYLRDSIITPLEDSDDRLDIE